MQTKILQINKEKAIFWSLIGALFLCAGFYMYFVNTTVHNVVLHQNLENEAAQLTLSISNKEFQYITTRNTVTLELAYSLGFKDTTSKTFISKTSLGQVSYLPQ